jgi:DNA-binding transcriptional regulator YiaG
VPKPHPDAAELKERVTRAKEWKAFRREFLFTQSMLANTLLISVRTLQNVEGARHTPLIKTQRLFNVHKAKFTAQKVA